MKVEIPHQVRITGKDGTEVTVDLTKHKMTEAQKSAFGRFLAHGDSDKMNDADKNVLKALKATVGGSGPHPEFICRFDLSWVRID